MSPGTSSAIGSSCSRPSRITAAVVATCFRISSTACLSLKLHEEVQQHAEQDHRDDDQSADGVAQRERYAAGHEKDDDQGIGQETEEAEQRSEARLPHQAVRAIETQPPRRLIGSQPGRSCL